jgi:RNA polymerase sigma factor (sigma-70 family)
MSNDKWLEEASEIATTVARSIHKRYAVYFEAHDVKQELIIWAMRKEHKVKEWLNPDQDPKDLKGGIRQLAKAMQREADKYCRTTKAKAVGYETRDEYFYNIGMIEELITQLDELDQQQGLSQAKVSGGGGDPATGNNVAAAVADVRFAMSKLDPQDQLMLEMRYQEGMTFSQISSALELSDTTVHRRVNSALKRMSTELGGENPWIATRRVVSNSQAQAMLE